MRVSRLIGSLVLLLLILTVFYWFTFDRHSFLGFEPGEAATRLPIWRIVLSAVALILGIASGAMHRLWLDRKEPMDLTAATAALRSAGLWRSLLAAPIVFSGVYAAAQTQPDYIVAMFFAFQTGFFTDTVVQPKTIENTPAK
jgi:hypothetical protein